jgi:hypothetical protein
LNLKKRIHKTERYSIEVFGVVFLLDIDGNMVRRKVFCSERRRLIYFDSVEHALDTPEAMMRRLMDEVWMPLAMDISRWVRLIESKGGDTILAAHRAGEAQR